MQHQNSIAFGLDRFGFGSLSSWIVAGAISAGCLGSLPSQGQQARFFSDRLLVKPAEDLEDAEVRGLLRARGVSEVDRLDALGLRIVHVPAERLEAVLADLQDDPDIEYAEPDFLVPPDATVNDPSFGSQWHLPKIASPVAWDTTVGDSRLIVAILDTGVDALHPDLVGKLVPGRNVHDGNDDTADVYGHGTKVAGTVAATGNNGVGIASVAFGCEIMPIRISDLQGYATSSAAAAGLTWAADRGARVANISYSMTPYSVVADAARYFRSKGGVVTVSAGNNGSTLTTADNPYVLTVSATDGNDALTSWSNRGPLIDVSAPGAGIYTTTRGGGYGAVSGTSFAAPVVAGVAALVISAFPDLSAAQVEQAVEAGAVDLGSAGWDGNFGWGRVDASRALIVAAQLTPSTPVTDTTAPTITIVSPADGSTVSRNSSAVTVSTQDDVGVTRVELWVDGRLESTSTSAPFTTKWNVRKASFGLHQLQCSATDAAGNKGWSQMVRVTK